MLTTHLHLVPKLRIKAAIFPPVRSQWRRGLRRGSALACWDCYFEHGRRHACLSLVSAVCCQVEVCVSGSSFVQMSLTECGMSQCEFEASMTRRNRPTGGCCAIRGAKICSISSRTLSFQLNRPRRWGLLLTYTR